MLKLKFLARSLAAAALPLLVLATGCVTTTDPDVKVAQTASEDEAYAAVLAKSTRAQSVFKNFETRVQISATYLSPEFRNAFGARLERVYKQTSHPFEEAGSKTGFFVSVNAPDDDIVDLSNPQHWTILMDAKDGALKPVLVKRLDDKERWRAFFTGVDPWTREYLVIFDVPPVDPKSPALVEKTSISVTFANADAQVKFTW